MYKCINLKSAYLNNFQNLNSQRLSFNNLNEDFFSIYNKVNVIEKIKLMKRVILLRDEETLDYIGYMWIYKFNRYKNKIRALSIADNYKYNIKSYLKLLDVIEDDTSITYFCEKNNYNYEVLKNLGFEKDEGILQMKRSIDRYMYMYCTEDINIKKFEINKDEELRCSIQNAIFESDSRIPLTVDDIYFEKKQQYFYKDGCVFLKLKDKTIGYGQIIFEDKIPCIVNFGILPEYRGMGYSRYLLAHLLNHLYFKHFNKAIIKVKPENTVALNLYESMGFQLEKEVHKWRLIK